MKRGMVFAGLFLVLVLGVSVFVNADITPSNSIDDIYTIENVLWGFDGNVVQNGQNVPVLFGFVNVSWNTYKGKQSMILSYLNLNNNFFLSSQRIPINTTNGKGYIHLDMVPSSVFTADSSLDIINTINVEIPFNSLDKILDSNEILSNNIKISQFYRDISFLSNNDITFTTIPPNIVRNITIDNWRKAALDDTNAGDYLTITQPYFDNHAMVSSLYDFLGNPFGNEGLVGARTDVSNVKVPVFSCSSAHGGGFPGSYTIYTLNCNSVCFDEQGFISLTKSIDDFCHIYNAKVNSITSSPLDLREVILVNPMIEQATGWSNLEW